MAGELPSTERFTIEAPLGRGGMGAVYRAYDRERGQRVALKTLIAPDAQSIYRFKREFRALADVAHPNLITLYDLVATGEDWCFTMELVDGLDFMSYICGRRDQSYQQKKNLTKTVEVSALGRIQGEPDSATALDLADSDDDTVALPEAPVTTKSRSYPKLDLNLLAPALIQLTEAIQTLHESGHLHRDIKPANILVTKEGRVVVLDLGVITEMSGGKRRADDKVAGTPRYMAPELFDSSEPSPASDWYAFGVILYQLLVGKRPFSGSPTFMLADKKSPESKS